LEPDSEEKLGGLVLTRIVVQEPGTQKNGRWGGARKSDGKSKIERGEVKRGRSFSTAATVGGNNIRKTEKNNKGDKGGERTRRAKGMMGGRRGGELENREGRGGGAG